jgi:RNA polymerase sigma-70 factor (ECF subfamily)
MVGVCERVLNSREAAEDCASEALLAVLTAGGLDNVRNEQAWLVRIAKRRAVDAVRREIRDRRRTVRLAGQADLGAGDVAEAVLDQAEARWLSRMAAEILPPLSAAVLDVVADGYSVGEAAAKLGMTKRAAESHLHRARTALRAAWAATLSLVGWFVSGLRRAAPAVPVTILAATLAVLGSPLLHPADRTPRSRPEVPMMAMPLEVVAPAASPTRLAATTGGRLVPASRRVPQPASTAPTRTTRRVSTPVAGIRLTREERPSPDDPVGSVRWCAQHLEVSWQRVGC